MQLYNMISVIFNDFLSYNIDLKWVNGKYGKAASLFV